jgi:TonB family protein
VVDDSEARILSLSHSFSNTSAKLPWFFRKWRLGHVVAPVAALDYCQGGTVSFRKIGTLLALTSVGAFLGVTGVGGQEANSEVLRRAKSKVAAVYPELARRMSLSGTVKVEVVVAPNGTVKDAKVVGGHPVLASAALEAVRKWRFEPAPAESTGIVDFKFEPHQ